LIILIVCINLQKNSTEAGGILRRGLVRTTMLLLAGALLILLYACDGRNETGEVPETQVQGVSAEPDSSATEEELQPAGQPVSAVCIYNGLAFWEGPSTKKGFKNYYLRKGEILTWLGESAVEEDDERQREFYHIRLSDGSEGWALADFIVAEGEPFAVAARTTIYNKNSLISKTDSFFEPLDIITVLEKQDDWWRVIGSYKSRQYWIRPGNVTNAEVDIAVANQVLTALGERDVSARKKRLEDILDEVAFTDSIFMPNVQEHLQEILDAEEKAQSPESQEEGVGGEATDSESGTGENE
jgi:hypothetical protein